MTGWGGADLTIRRGGKVLLDAVTLWFAPGTMTALVGPNGSGKTTLLRVLGGLIPPDSGTVAQGEVKHWHEDEWARTVACSLDSAAEEIPFCVEEILLSSQFPGGGRWLDPSAARRRPLVDILDRLEVFPEGGGAGLDRAYATLSAGERQLVDVSRAVLQRTPVLLLDEPTSALDLRHRLLVTELLRTEAEERGRTVVQSLHNLGEMGGAFGAVAVLHKGRLVAAGVPTDVMQDTLLAQVWGVVPMAGGFRLL